MPSFVTRNHFSQITGNIARARLMMALLLLVASAAVWPTASSQGETPTPLSGSRGETPASAPLLTAQDHEYLAALGPLTVCPDPDWIPFEHVSPSGTFTGIAADLLTLVAQRLGIEFHYVLPANWDEAVALSKAGKVLILPFLNQTPAREQWLLFTEPLLVDPNVFITREEHPYIADPSQLSGKSIVLPRNTSMEERVRKDFPGLAVINADSEMEVFQTISERRADMTLRSLTVAAYTIRKEGLFNLKVAGQAPEEYTNRLRMGVLKSEPRLRNILDKGIASITPREREAIVNRHVNITVVKPFDSGLVFRIAAALSLLIILSYYWNYRLRRINTALNESERSKSVLLANLPGIAYRCRFDDAWTMEFISQGCRELTGYTSDDLLYNRVLSFNDLIHPEDRDWIKERWENNRQGSQPVQLEYRIVAADRREKWVFEQGLPIHDQRGEIVAIEGLIIDITDRKRAEEALYQTSIVDHLTGLFNRRYFFERLQVLVEELKRNGKNFSLAIIDIDFFKRINDTHGHLVGDMVLKGFAALVAENFRPYDLVGRYGGEEFVVVIKNIDTDQTEHLLCRLRDKVKAHVFACNGTALQVTFSAGMVSTAEPFEEKSVESLIHTADERLYLAKKEGRDRIIAMASARACLPEGCPPQARKES
jgi:diguanylate cyclase (GGDEF)-like protein/PAS domain S-box-containing protein